MEVLAAETSAQQERLQAISEKRRRQEEIEGKRRQLEEDRRQLQHLKSKALRERWLLEGTPPATEGDEALQQQMQEDKQRARLLEASIARLETEIEALENGDVSLAPAAVPSPTPEGSKAEVMVNSQQTPVGTPKAETRVSNTPVRMTDGATRMKAAMYSVEITVEKDKVTGETRVLSSSTRSPQQPLPQGVKVYEDETKVVHAVDGAAENGVQPLSSSEVAELIHKAEEAAARPAEETAPTARTPPARREITGLCAEPDQAPPDAHAGQEPPVTMIFMGYQSVEDEAETKKVLGLQDTVTAELVVIGDAPKSPAPPNGSAAEPPAAAPPDEQPPAPTEAPDSDPKKQPCKCCSVM
ncbi:paralemmin-1 isoform X1 [Erinaceus europaeus]|uniref:Paralemmin-1 n=1 Tax=Erinaceus europaeus TaxID=9365 RepID=A0A1S3WDJ0_ERIEU|nr:paralemmin-1 isoform X1 [Erinaceus europaeus]